MIQLCGKSIAIPLKLLFKTIIEEGAFPEDWKKRYVVPMHKKESKNLIKNYRPISLLPIFSKVLERLIFKSMFTFFRQNNLFTKCQSCFIPGETSVLLNYYQLTMKLTKALILAQREILKGFSSIFQKLLIRLGMKVYFLNCSLME